MTANVPVGDLLAYAIGGGWGDEEPAEHTQPCYVIRGTDLATVRLGSLEGVPRRFETEKRLAGRSLEDGDIILEVSGGSKGQPTGRTALVTERLLAGRGWPVIPASFCRLLRPNRDLVAPRYLYYCLQDMYASGRVWAYQNQSTGIANFQMKVFTKSELVWLPPLEEQARIAGVLGAFDDLIETNMSTVRALEHLGKTSLSALGAAEPTLQVVTLSEACSIIESGRRPKGGVAGIKSGVPSLGAESVNGLTEFNFAKTKYVPEEFAASMKRGVLTDLDVLVYKDGGKPGEFFPDVSIVGSGYPFEKMVINEHVYRVRAAHPLSQGYLYFWLSTDEMMRRMREIGSRTAAIPGMNSTNFGQLPIPIPSVGWRIANLHALDQLVEGALSLLAECRDLARRRDELLPLLMSGRVRVRDLEAVA